MTQKEILTEYTKGLTDPVYIIENYLKAYDKTQNGYVPFKLFPRQVHIIDAYMNHDKNIVTKPRQAGVSTTTAAFLSWRVGFASRKNPEKILILANKQAMAFEFLDKVREFVQQLPRWLWGPDYYGSEENEKRDIFVKNSQKEFELPNKCRVKAVATSKDALRGYTPTFLVFDEAAFIDNGAEVFGAAMSSISTGGAVSLISTPNGNDELYYNTYDQAMKKENNFNIVEMRWYEDLRYNKDLEWVKDDERIKESEYTLEGYKQKVKEGYKPTSSWYRDMCKSLNNDARMIAQELDVSFVGSGSNVIHDDYIKFHQEFNVKEPKFIDGNEKEFWIWEEPKDGHKYVLSCLPPNEKVLTNNGMKNIEDVLPNDKLINEHGKLVDIINRQVTSVIDEDIYDIKVSNTYRSTKFTKNHPILISKPNLKRNYKKNDSNYKFNERYHDFNFEFTKAESVEVGDWTRVPNTYKKELPIPNGLWDTYLNNVRCDFKIDDPSNDVDFWWFMGLYLGDGHLYINESKHIYSVSITFSSDELDYMYDSIDIIKKLFKRSPSVSKREDTNCHTLTFNSKALVTFIKDNLGQYSDGKKISEWIKYLPKKYKYELVRGYFDSDGSWIKVKKRKTTNSKITFTSVNLELLEDIQDILFSIDIISSLNKLRDAKFGCINGRRVNQKITYSLSLHNDDSIKLHKLIYKINDIKLNKFNIIDFDIINKRAISNCYFSNDYEYIYFKIKDKTHSIYSGNVYNFETDTHTFMCKNITTHNCDVARGDGSDYSVFTIIDFTDMEQVMEYRGKVPPDVLAMYVKKYADLYDAYVVVDNIGVGVSTVLKLMELGCKNMHYDVPSAGAIRVDSRLNNFTKDGKTPGFNVSKVRLPMIQELEFSIRENVVAIRSTRIIAEMRTFIYKNGRPDHVKGKNDDCLITLAMAVWVIQRHFKQLESNVNQSKAMLDSWALNTGGATSSLNPENLSYNGKDFGISADGYVSRGGNNISDDDNLWVLGGMF